MMSCSSMVQGAVATHVVSNSRSAFSSLVEQIVPAVDTSVLTRAEGLRPDANRLAWKSVSCVSVERYVFQLSSFILSTVLLKAFLAFLYFSLFSSVLLALNAL